MEATTTNRPTIKEAANAVAAKMLDSFISWCQYKEAPSERERDEVLDVLAKTFRHYGLDDGYVIARQLEDNYMVEADESLVTLMSGVQKEMEAEIDRLTKAWVKANSIDPPFEFGAKVAAKWGLRTIQGLIKEIRFDVAKYGIEVPGTEGLHIVEFEKTGPQTA